MKIHYYITPQNWIFLHVIGNDFAGIHVTEVQFTSLLCTIRATYNQYVLVFCVLL